MYAGIDEWRRPVWSKAGKIHDWRNHVPKEVRAIWDTFSNGQTYALYGWALKLSDGEEWD